MESIKDHFEKEAQEFDEIIKNLIPYYTQMVEALVDSIPFKANSNIRVIDLGCGTGTITKKIAQKFPNAQITCLDMAENMINISKQKLKHYKNIEFICKDFAKMEFAEEFDVVVSSLALHHLETDAKKKIFYKKIYNALKKSGVFFNADVVLASTDYLQKVYIKKWKTYMQKSVAIEEINNKWIPKYKSEDRPAKIVDQINWLNKIGYSSVDIIWKYYNFCVYGGIKQ